MLGIFANELGNVVPKRGLMIDPKTLDTLVGRIVDGMPAGLGRVRDDLRGNLRAAVSAALARMDLVTREEFDAQRAVLARTREKLESLQQQLEELEGS